MGQRPGCRSQCCSWHPRERTRVMLSLWSTTSARGCVSNSVCNDGRHHLTDDGSQFILDFHVWSPFTVTFVVVNSEKVSWLAITNRQTQVHNLMGLLPIQLSPAAAQGVNERGLQEEDELLCRYHTIGATQRHRKSIGGAVTYILPCSYG